ncbi:TetR/AcrR family transcriptional regulator [Mycobacterium sp. pW049]|uniref:TetR/AcrR family transcriptional regulator n=1 Tax=[Mycobacterium] bulgaricum TaxID=3238985 RepID=UPI00351B118C
MPRERIIAAALELVDAEGADALSMRTLAQSLNSGTATLYRHFANRAQLVGEVVDLVFAEADPGALRQEGRGWRRDCAAFATAMYSALGEHPNVAQLMLEQTPLGPNAMSLRESALSVLLANGFSPELAARSYATLSRFVLGFAIQMSGRDDSRAAQDSAVFHGVEASRFPATLAVADALPVPLDEEFAFGLELIIKGLGQIRRRR